MREQLYQFFLREPSIGWFTDCIYALHVACSLLAIVLGIVVLFTGANPIFFYVLALFIAYLTGTYLLVNAVLLLRKWSRP